MAINHEAVDGIFLSIAKEQCEGDIKTFLDLVFGFLARKTDFFVGADKSASDKVCSCDISGWGIIMFVFFCR